MNLDPAIQADLFEAIPGEPEHFFEPSETAQWRWSIKAPIQDLAVFVQTYAAQFRREIEKTDGTKSIHSFYGIVGGRHKVSILLEFKADFGLFMGCYMSARQEGSIVNLTLACSPIFIDHNPGEAQKHLAAFKKLNKGLFRFGILPFSLLFAALCFGFHLSPINSASQWSQWSWWSAGTAFFLALLFNQGLSESRQRRMASKITIPDFSDLDIFTRSTALRAIHAIRSQIQLRSTRKGSPVSCRYDAYGQYYQNFIGKSDERDIYERRRDAALWYDDGRAFYSTSHRPLREINYDLYFSGRMIPDLDAPVKMEKMELFQIFKLAAHHIATQHLQGHHLNAENCTEESP